MESNKDEALRCIGIAKEAIASGNKQRALKFINIARRLNPNLFVDDLLASCEEGSDTSSSSRLNQENEVSGAKDMQGHAKVDGVSNGERTYTEEHVQLIQEIKSERDYYKILGVDKSCSVEEIKKAYRKLSLKVHPDKNKAPGSEEAFKKVCKAFKCLSEDESRRQYDQFGLLEEFEQSQQYNVRRRRRRTGHDFYDDSNADEIFRAFFGHDMFRSPHVYRTRTRATASHQRDDEGRCGTTQLIFLQLLPFLLIILIAVLTHSDPEYSVQRNHTYQFRKTTEKYGVEYFVKSSEFDESHPPGSPARENIELNVMKDYKNMLGRYCHIEMQRRQWNRNYPTPHCDRLHDFAVA